MTPRVKYRCQRCGDGTVGTLLCADCQMDIARGYAPFPDLQSIRVNWFCIGMVVEAIVILLLALVLQ